MPYKDWLRKILFTDQYVLLIFLYASLHASAGKFWGNILYPCVCAIIAMNTERYAAYLYTR